MDYRNLFRELEANLARIDRTDDVLLLLSAMVERLVGDVHEDLGLARSRPPIPRVQELLRAGFVLQAPGDPGLDPTIEKHLGARTLAAIQVGESRQQIIAFSLRDSSDRDHVIFMRNTIRHAVNLKLRKPCLEDRLAETRESTSNGSSPPCGSSPGPIPRTTTQRSWPSSAARRMEPPPLPQSPGAGLFEPPSRSPSFSFTSRSASHLARITRWSCPERLA